MQRTSMSQLPFNPIHAFQEHHEARKASTQIESILSNLSRSGCNVTESFNQLTRVLSESQVHHISGELLARVYSLGIKQVNYNLTQRSQGAYARVDFSVEEIKSSYTLVQVITEKYSDKIQAHCTQNSTIEIEFNAFQEHIERFNSMQIVGGQFTEISETLVQMISIHMKLTIQNNYSAVPVNHKKLTCMLSCYHRFLKEKFEYQEGRCSQHCSRCLNSICEMMASFQSKFSAELRVNAEMRHETSCLFGVMVHKFHDHLSPHHFHAAFSMHIAIWKNCEAHVRIKILEKLSCSFDKLKDFLMFIKAAIGAGIYFVLEETKCILENLFKHVACAARHTVDFVMDLSCKIMHELSCGLHLIFKVSADLFAATVKMMLAFSYQILHAGKAVGHGIHFILQIFISIVSSCNVTRCPVLKPQDIQYIEQVSIQYQYTALTQEVHSYQEQCRNVA